MGQAWRLLNDDLLRPYGNDRNRRQTAFTINWDAANGHYMATSDVKATISGTITTAFTVVGNTVTFTVAPANGADVVIYRRTALDVLELFERRGTPSSGGFNDVMRRIQYIGQELLDIGVATAEAANSALTAMRWATNTTGTVVDADTGVDSLKYSAKEYAQGTQASTGGSSKNWAQQTGAGVTGAAANSRSSKSWSQDALTGATLGGSSKDWAQNVTVPVDGTSFSSKEYAQGSQAATGGSAKNWAQATGADVTGAAANSRSSKSWAQDNLTGATLGGSSKDWAQSGSLPDGVNKSSKSYAADSAASAVAASNSASAAAASAASLTYATITEALTGTATNRMMNPDTSAALWERGTDIASASTIHIPNTGGRYFVVTGTTNITAIVDDITAHNGRTITLRFSGALTLTHNVTSLILPGAASITTASGDVAKFTTEDGTNWRCVGYMKESGLAVISPSVAYANYAESSNITITSGGSWSYSPAIGNLKDFSLWLKCTTAELNYAVGDMVKVSGDNSYSTNNTGAAAYIAASALTNVNGRFGTAAGAFEIQDISLATKSLITNTKWALVVRAVS
jgi:hypothetical protein